MPRVKLFEEDEVGILKGKDFKCGLVTQSSEYQSSSSSEDEDDGFGSSDNKLPEGMIRVAWHPEGEEEVLLEDDVMLVDRSFMPSDVVASHSTGQKGYILNTHIKCHLKVLNKNYVICDVDARQLIDTQRFSPQSYVYLDSYVGIVESVVSKLTLAFTDGAKCELLDNHDALVFFEDIRDGRDQVSIHLY